MKWFRNPFKRKSPPVSYSAASSSAHINPEFQQFIQDLGPDFWPGCSCFTDEQSRQDMIANLYHLATQASDNLMMNMTVRGFCVKSGPAILALLVNRVLAVGAAGTAQTKVRGREPRDSDMLAELTDDLGSFQLKMGRLSARTMEKLGCTKS